MRKGTAKPATKTAVQKMVMMGRATLRDVFTMVASRVSDRLLSRYYYYMCHVIDVTSHSVTTQVEMDSKKAEPKADTEPEESTSSLEESDIEKCFHTSR